MGLMKNICNRNTSGRGERIKMVLLREATKKIIATVQYVNEVCTDDDTYLEISTNEFEAKLRIRSEVCNNIHTDDIESLKKNQKIFVRIEKIYVEELETDSYINLVSLSTEEEQIFTLDEYNTYVRQLINYMRSIIRSMVMLIVVCLGIQGLKPKSVKG